MKVFRAPIPPESRSLVYALVFTILCHGAGLLSMVGLLVPGMPGGTSDLAHRANYVAEHSLLWRLGWFPWQLTAFSDLIFAIALIRTPWIPKMPAFTTLIFTVAAVVVEQPAEYRWISTGVELAKQSVLTGQYNSYAVFEQDVFFLTGNVAAVLYTIGAVFWSIALAKGGAWNKMLTWLSVVLWGLLFLVSANPILRLGLPQPVITIGNAIGFNLMMIWFFAVFYLIKARPSSHTP